MAKKRISKRYSIAKSPIPIYDASYEEMVSSDKELAKVYGEFCIMYPGRMPETN